MAFVMVGIVPGHVVVVERDERVLMRVVVDSYLATGTLRKMKNDTITIVNGCKEGDYNNTVLRFVNPTHHLQNDSQLGVVADHCQPLEQSVIVEPTPAVFG